MAWRQSDDTWVLNSGAPTLTAASRPERVLDDLGDRRERPRRRAGCDGHACRACSVRAGAGCSGRNDWNAKRQRRDSPGQPPPPTPELPDHGDHDRRRQRQCIAFDVQRHGDRHERHRHEERRLHRDPDSVANSSTTTYSAGCTNANGVGDGATVNCVVTNTYTAGGKPERNREGDQDGGRRTQAVQRFRVHGSSHRRHGEARPRSAAAQLPNRRDRAGQQDLLDHRGSCDWTTRRATRQGAPVR